MSKYIYVYTLLSNAFPNRHYTGLTENLTERVGKHNRGEVAHTAKFAPWRLEIAIAFRERAKAVAFEKHLKSGSGREFARRHF